MTARTRSAPPSTGTSARLLAVAFAALVLRGIVVATFADHPLLRPEGGLDSDVYVQLARMVAGGDLLLRGAPGAFFVSPLYVYFAGLVLALSGGALGAILAVQALLGAAAVWLTGDAARRLYGDAAAVPAAALLALTGVVAFHESIILQAALDPFLAALALWLLVRALEKGSLARYAAAGSALGLFALNRPNVLPWAAVVAVLLVVSRGFLEGGKAAATFALGALLGIAPATLRNLAVAGEPVLISSHGGLNLLVGNGPGAAGVYRWMDGIRANIAGQATDATRVAEAETGRKLTARETSAHFAGKAWAWMAAEPGAAARLLARKVWYVLSGDEAPLNFSVPWYRRHSLLLRLLVVGPWILVPLGGVGLLFALLGVGRLPRLAAAVWVSFAPAYVLLVAAFFVATRYRLPLYVPLATAAGGAAVLLLDLIRARDIRRLALAAAVAVPLGIVALWPTGIDDGSWEEETLWVLHLAEAGNGEEAARRAEALAGVHPQPGVLWFRLGQAWASTGRLDAAVEALTRSLSIDSAQPETMKVLAAVRERRGLERALAGQAAGAAEDFEAAVRLDPQNASAHLNLAAVLAERGERGRAREESRRALALRPSYEKAEALLRALGPEK